MQQCDRGRVQLLSVLVARVRCVRPFIDATVENGCMQVLRGGHRAGVTVGHIGCSGGTWYVETDEALMPDSLQLDVASNTITVPVRRGDVLLLNNLIPHRSLPNLSTVIRWSIDLRWQDAHKPSGYTAKPVLPLTKQDEPNYRPQWDEWAQQDRQKLVADKAAANAAQHADSGQLDQQKDPFDTHIIGPAHSNTPHTAAAAMPAFIHADAGDAMLRCAVLTVRGWIAGLCDTTTVTRRGGWH